MRALHMAATHNQVEVCQLLIDFGCELRCKDNEDITPLHCAAGEGNIKIVQLLFEAAAKADGWVTISNVSGCFNFSSIHIGAANNLKF